MRIFWHPRTEKMFYCSKDTFEKQKILTDASFSRILEFKSYYPPFKFVGFSKKKIFYISKDTFEKHKFFNDKRFSLIFNFKSHLTPFKHVGFFIMGLKRFN